MGDIVSSKFVKTRKEHRCWGCARTIPKGSSANAVKSTDMGKIATNYWCGTCHEYWNRYMQYGDEIGYGDLKGEDREGWEIIRKEIEEEFSVCQNCLSSLDREKNEFHKKYATCNMTCYKEFQGA